MLRNPLPRESKASRISWINISGGRPNASDERNFRVPADRFRIPGRNASRCPKFRRAPRLVQRNSNRVKISKAKSAEGKSLLIFDKYSVRNAGFRSSIA